MKRTMLSAVIMTFLVLSLAGQALAQEDVKLAPTCQYCGMDRTKFAHTRMLVTYDDDTKAGTCSIHCLALELSIQTGKTPVSIEVGDYILKKLIDAEQAYWVIGGNKPGVMTKQGEWAFAKKVYAEKFIREHGGTLATFEEAMQAAYENMYTATKARRAERGMKAAQGRDPK